MEPVIAGGEARRIAQALFHRPIDSFVSDETWRVVHEDKERFFGTRDEAIAYGKGRRDADPHLDPRFTIEHHVTTELTFDLDAIDK